ncbi:hypothetical protein V3C99_017144 [Haemonchus contortus]
MNLINSDDSLPPYIKIILEVLRDTRDQMVTINQWCGRLSEENEKLKAENSELKKLLESNETPPTKDISPSSPSFPQGNDSVSLERELERTRSVVIHGIPEFSSPMSVNRAFADFNAVLSILNHLDVECIPCNVYRLGRPDSNRSRLVKVIFPSSVFQRIVLKRASRMRSFFYQGVYIRPSRTKEERERIRKEQATAKRNSSQSQSVTVDVDAIETVSPTSVSNNVSGNSKNV